MSFSIFCFHFCHCKINVSSSILLLGRGTDRQKYPVDNCESWFEEIHCERRPSTTLVLANRKADIRRFRAVFLAVQSLLYPLLALSSPSGDSTRLGDWNLVCLSIFAKLFRAIFLLVSLFSAMSIRFLSRVSDVVTFGVMTEKREETGSRFFEFSGDQTAAIAQISTVRLKST